MDRGRISFGDRDRGRISFGDMDRGRISLISDRIALVKDLITYDMMMMMTFYSAMLSRKLFL
jgi:hypothetical protein